MRVKTDQPTRIRCLILAAAAVCIGGWGASSLYAQTKTAAQYRDVGSAHDFDTTQNIYFDETGSFNGSGKPGYWDLESDATGGAVYENDHGFWWVTAPPPNEKNIISSRDIRFHQYGRFRVKADKLPAQGNLTLTLRIKDDLLSPAPVYSWAGGNKWIKLGGIGGQRNHEWITRQFTVKAADRAVDKKTDTYVFKIGQDQYTSTMRGELPVDRIKLAAGADKSDFPPDQPGYWPTDPKSRFSNLGKTMEFIPGQGPFLPFGLYDWIWITDGGTATQPGHGKLDSWQILQDAHANCYIIHGWDQNWHSQWKTEKVKWSNKPRINPGLKEHLIQAAGHHLKVIPNFLTDTQSKRIKKIGGEQNALKAMGRAMTEFDQNPNLLMWFPVDEWDHEKPTYGKPHLYSHLLYHTLREASPHRAGLSLSMGYLGPDTWRLSAEDADIVATDTYPTDFGGIEKGLEKQAERLTEMRHALQGKTPFLLVGEVMGAQDKTIINSPADIVAQGYMGLIQGSSGLLWFRYKHPQDPSFIAPLWDGFKQMGSELFGPQGISSLFLPPSKPIDLVGESKIVTTSNPDVIASLFEDGRGNRTLIALNIKKAAAQNVTFTIKGLKDGQVKLHFDPGRTLQAKDGAFSDDFSSLQRHVYELGK